MCESTAESAVMVWSLRWFGTAGVSCAFGMSSGRSGRRGVVRRVTWLGCRGVAAPPPPSPRVVVSFVRANSRPPRAADAQGRERRLPAALRYRGPSWGHRSAATPAPQSASRGPLASGPPRLCVPGRVLCWSTGRHSEGACRAGRRRTGAKHTWVCLARLMHEDRTALAWTTGRSTTAVVARVRLATRRATSEHSQPLAAPSERMNG